MGGAFPRAMLVAVALSACTLSDLQRVAQELFEVSTNPPTAGDPKAPLKIDGVRLAEDFNATGKLFVHFSVIPDSADLTDNNQLVAQFAGAGRAVFGDAVAEIEFPSPNRESKRFSGILETSIGGIDYSGSFNVSR